MAELPKLGGMDGVPPAIRYQIARAVDLLPRDASHAFDGLPLDHWTRMLDAANPWIGADPALADLGYWMIHPTRALEVRRQGARWLHRFPTVATIKKLAALALDPATPSPVRDEAIHSLGVRQVRAMHAATQWAPDAVQIADEALARIADAATADGTVPASLAHVMRHASSDLALAIFARAPGLWGEALECFASPAVARVLFVSLDEIPPEHRLRAIRLVGATLGDEAAPLFVGRATSGVAMDEKLELLLLSVGLGGEAYLGKLEDALVGLRYVDQYRQRARWHLANRWVVPTVRGLKVARTTALIPAADRAARCAQAASDLAALAKFARHPEAYLYEMWGWMVRGAGEPARATELALAHPESARLVRALYLEDLARRGRVRQLATAAQTLDAVDTGALQLAIHGRPLAALELAATARSHTAELVCARALATYRAGRGDLTARILVEDLPPTAVVESSDLPAFPGPHERWMRDRAPNVRPAITALAHGRDSVIAMARPAPEDAEPDAATLEPIAAVVRRLGRGLAGSTVFLAGEFTTLNKPAISAAVARHGARLVAGPFPGTDYYVHGDYCVVQTIAQLERQGARRLRLEELGI